jgi:hypothetical protein
MAIAATAGSAANSSSSVSSLALPSFNIAASQHTVVSIALGSTSSSVTSITDTKGNTYTQKAGVNGTGVRGEIWACANSGAQTSNIITVNISPSTTISAQAEQRSGVGSFGNTATAVGTSTIPKVLDTIQEGSNWVIAGIGFACQSGDTLTATEGVSRQSSIPAATATGGAQYDNTANGVGQLPNSARISTSRNWAAVALELRASGAVATPYADYAAGALAPTLQVSGDVRSISGMMPVFTARAPSSFTPVPVGAILKGGTAGAAYTATIDAQNGTSPYTFAVTSGSLPAGTSLNSSTGVISGTPTTAGTYSFTITVTDSLGYTGSTSFQIVIAAPSGGGGSFTFHA